LLESLPEPVLVAPEARRSEIWPLALALIVGAAIGFGGGYFFAHFERGAEPAIATPTETPAPSGREFTETTIAEAPTAPAPAAGAPVADSTLPASPAVPAGPAPVTPGTAKPATPATGRLLVRSTPSGARVFVDGREEGTTPLTVSDLDRGVHRVRVVREGYATAERRITITAARPSQTMSVPLARARTAQTAAAPAAGPGKMTVISRPAGARVFVDEKLVGTTPLQLPSIAAGSHRVRLELAGYKNWVSSVDVAAAEQKRVAASLDR
jgi:hypothetical protein